MRMDRLRSFRGPLIRPITWVLVGGLVAIAAPWGAAQVFVEDSPAAAELLGFAEDRLEKGEPEEAAKLVQKLLDEHGSRLLELEPGRYAEARRVVARRLLEQPVLL